MSPFLRPTSARMACFGFVQRVVMHSLPSDRAPHLSPGNSSCNLSTTRSELEFAGTSAVHLEALRQADRLAPFEHATVLIEGETGTGKSYLARYLHLRSPRARGPFHQVILSSLDDNLAASDLFGHLSGSYTDARQNRPGHFVSANRGTLFLDEIGKASSAVQRKLLHAIEHQEIWPVGADRAVRLDVRLVAATNIPLHELVAAGSFLEDLAARLATFRVRLPALRDRRDDIPALVRQFVAMRASMCGHASPPRIDKALMDALQRADWPYNLRQLDGVVQRLLMEAAAAYSAEVTLSHCVADLAYLSEARPQRMPAPEVVRERMRELGSATATARSLGISRWTVYRYVEQGVNHGDDAAGASR
jgi:DNA-binding NtrC family response regulator